MQALFDETAIGGEARAEEESSLVDQLEDLQAEYEEQVDQEDPNFIEDAFAACELGEALCKNAQEKEKEAKQKAASEKKESEKKTQLQKKPAAKEGEKAPEDKPVEPNLEYLWQLKDMGFPEDLGRLALIKVKNESVAAAVEAVVALQVE
jgi:hypothetical protein